MLNERWHLSRPSHFYSGHCQGALFVMRVATALSMVCLIPDFFHHAFASVCSLFHTWLIFHVQCIFFSFFLMLSRDSLHHGSALRKFRQNVTGILESRKILVLTAF